MLSSGTATLAQLIVDTRSQEPNLLATSDVVCFDEVTAVTGLEDIASKLRNYLSSGTAWLGLEMLSRARARHRRLQPEEFEEGDFGFQVDGDGKTVAVRLTEEQ